jgi:uncharacterized protein (DUF433 family)
MEPYEKKVRKQQLRIKFYQNDLGKEPVRDWLKTLQKDTRKDITFKTLDKHIDITPGTVRGKPRIAGHRITVQNIVIWYDRMGKSADEIATEYDLELADIHAALAYYFDHRAEIDKAIEECDIFVNNMCENAPSKLRQKIQENRAA